MKRKCKCKEPACVWAIYGDKPVALCFVCYGQSIRLGVREIQVPIAEELPEDWRERY